MKKKLKLLLEKDCAGYTLKIICVALITAMIIVGIFLYGAPIVQLALLFFFVAIYVFIPGLLIIRGIHYKDAHISTNMALGFFLGWALCVLEYFFADLLNSNIILYSLGPLMSLYYFYLYAYRKEQNGLIISRIDTRRISNAFCVFLTLAVLYCLLNTQYRFLSPETDRFILVNPDKAYHMGLINSLSHDYPLVSPWVQGKSIHYHIFAEILWSIPVRLFGLTPDVVTQSFAPLITACCVGVSLYSLFREMTSKPNRAGLYCLVFIMSHIYITRSWDSSLGLQFILVNDNSTGYGVSAALMFVVAFNYFYKAYCADRRESYKYLLVCIVMIMLTTGIKGPIGAVLVAGLWGSVVLGVLLRKITLRTFIPLFLITAGFILVYTTILGASGQVNAPGGASIGFGGIANIAFWKSPLAHLLRTLGLPKIARMPIMMLVFVMFFFTAYAIPFCAGYARELILVIAGKKDYDLPRVLIYASCLVGYLAMFMLHYRGHNQVYFGMLTLALAPIVAYWFIEDMEAKSSQSVLHKGALEVTVCIMAVMLICTSVSLISSYKKQINTAAENLNPEKKADKYLSMSNAEYQAMKWIYHNADKDALLINDRYYSVDPKKYSYEDRWGNRFFLYEVVANRFSYLGGSGYDLRKADNPLRKERVEKTEQLINANNEKRGEQARELGVDYVILSKRFSGERNLENEDYKLCYSNDDIDIYEVQY